MNSILIAKLAQQTAAVVKTAEADLFSHNLRERPGAAPAHNLFDYHMGPRSTPVPPPAPPAPPPAPPEPPPAAPAQVAPGEVKGGPPLTASAKSGPAVRPDPMAVGFAGGRWHGPSTGNYSGATGWNRPGAAAAMSPGAVHPMPGSVPAGSYQQMQGPGVLNTLAAAPGRVPVQTLAAAQAMQNRQGYFDPNTAPRESPTEAVDVAQVR